MDQLRLDFKLNFFFLKNLKSNLYFHTTFIKPTVYIDFQYPDLRQINANFVFENNIRKLVAEDNNVFMPKKIFKPKRVKCKKIFSKKNFFINLLYF